MLLSALVESSAQFSGLAPIGYERMGIRWVVEIDSPTGAVGVLGPFEKGTLDKNVPTRGDRSGTVAEGNMKPALLVDRASYVFGIDDEGKVDTAALDLEHKGFLGLLENACLEMADREVSEILQFLRDRWPMLSVSSESDSLVTENLRRFRDFVRRNVKRKDLVAIRSGGDVFPFEKSSAHLFWANYLDRSCSEGTAFCSVCGARNGAVRILPWQIAFFGYSCPSSRARCPACPSLPTRLSIAVTSRRNTR
jgi:CRISPR-associated protein (Cas_Csd1)